METPKSSYSAAVVLAAGLSSRMGRQKLLLEIDGMPLIRKVAAAYCAAGMSETLVVTGHERQAVEQAVASLGVRCVFNPDYAQGQAASIRAGLAALTEACDLVLIGLGDMPLLDAADIRALRQRWAASAQPICVPFCAGQRGHPIAFAAGQIEAILAGRLRVGQQRLIEDNPERVDCWESDNPHYVIDIDTPADLSALPARAGKPTG